MTSTTGKLRRGPTDILELYNWTRLPVLRQKGKITAEFVRRVKKLCRSKSNGGNLISLINAWGVGVVHYSAGIADRTVEELDSLDSKTRTESISNEWLSRHQIMAEVTMPECICRGRKGQMDWC